MEQSAFTDESLMERIQAGQLEACGLLYQRYKKVLFSYFYNNLSQQQQSEDMVQGTFERLLKYRKNYRGDGTVKAWLFSIARNALLDEWKKGKRRRSQPVDESLSLMADDRRSGEEKMMLDERMALLNRAMQRLTPEKREMLSMIKLKGKKYKEVAEIYQMNESTLKVNIFRIVKELKDYMKAIEAPARY